MADIRVRLRKAAFGSIHDMSSTLLLEALNEIERLHREVSGISQLAIYHQERAESCETALRVARVHVVATNRAEGMLDGFGQRRARSSDDDLALIDAALHIHDREGGGEK